jgi:hypothetical protein
MDITNTAIDILQPVIESAVVLSARYAKECNRDTITPSDINYAMKFCARNITGNHIGTLYPEIYAESESDEEDDDFVTDDETEEFTRYTGTDELMCRINDCYDTWDEWRPDAPIEISIKNAIDNAPRPMS